MPTPQTQKRIDELIATGQWRLADEREGDVIFRDHVIVSTIVELPRFPAGGYRWRTSMDSKGRLVRFIGPYTVTRAPRAPARFSYEVCRDGIELPLSMTSSLSQAKAHVYRNALGKERMNIA